MAQQHIHPIFDRLLQRADKEALLQQRSKVLWFTGLSGSGKSTIAQGLEARLYSDGFLTQVLDGDNIRSGINNNLGFSLADREENIRRVAEIAKLYLHSGVITIVSFISPTREAREYARRIIGEDDFLEIYINAPIEVCEARDVKGLYQKARRGEIREFSGIDSPYEAPEHPSLEIKTDMMSIESSIDRICDYLYEMIALPKANPNTEE